jgi:hypothetical protein
MKTENFTKLINLLTNRDFTLATTDAEIETNKEYTIYRLLPISKSKISFKWKTPTNEENFIRSFITAFTTKYREPRPKSYDYTYGGKEYRWADMTDEQKEFAYYHHASNMYSKKQLLEMIEDNFSREEIKGDFCKYGFYPTMYGVGIFAFWTTKATIYAIDQMKKYLSEQGIIFSNEFSDAKWVYRFKINASKPIHMNLLHNFSHQNS